MLPALVVSLVGTAHKCNQVSYGCNLEFELYCLQGKSHSNETLQAQNCIWNSKGVD